LQTAVHPPERTAEAVGLEADRADLGSAAVGHPFERLAHGLVDREVHYEAAT